MNHHSVCANFRAALSTLLLLAITVSAAWAQGSQSQAKEPRSTQARSAQPPAPQAPSRSKEASCDGALEIVPSQPMSFARKRRPKVAPAATETQAEKKKAGEAQ